MHATYSRNIDDRAECKVRAMRFLDSRPDVKAFFDRHRDNERWAFPRDVEKKLFDWGSLTPNQLAAIERGIARDADFDAKRAPAPKEFLPEQKTSDIDLSNVPDGMYAVPGGDTRLKVQIKRGKRDTKWSNVIFVSDGAAYGQRKNYGRQYPNRAYTGEIQDELRAIAADPKAAMAAYGHLVGKCGLCGRHLEDEQSIARGIGPVCAGKLGW